jgi:MFS family permease
MIYVLAFLMNMVTGLMICSNPLVSINRLGASIFALGAMGSLASGAYSIGCAFAGRLADRWGAKKMMALGCAIILCLYPMIILVRELWQMFVFVIVSPLAGALFWPALMKHVGEEENKEDLQARVGGFNMAWSAGIMIGPFLGGRLYPIDYRLAYFLSAGLILLALVITLLSPRGMEESPLRPPPETTVAARDPCVKWFIYIGWLANFSAWFSISSAESLFPKLALTLSVGPKALGALLACVGLGQFLMFALLRKTDRWHYNLPLLISFQVLGMISLIIFKFTSAVPLFAAAFFLLGLCAGLCYFSSLFYSLYRQEEKGQKSGFHEAILAAAVSIGPLSGGALARFYGLRTPYVACFVLFAISIAAQITLMKARTPKSCPGFERE